MSDQLENPNMDEMDASEEADLEWFRSSDDVRKGVVAGVTFGPKEVEFSVLEGQAIFEGDIVLFTKDEMEDLSTRGLMPTADVGGTLAADMIERGVAITGQRYRWPRGIVPYEIDPAMPGKQRITNAINHIHQNTRIRLVPRTTANASQYQNYVRFVSKDGCWSHVGMRGGMQEISLGTGCGFGASVHEILHAIGLWHEQSREDRNNFVTINLQNIPANRRHNFNQHITDGDDINTYDYGSLMHYGRFAFSMNGQPTIVPHGGQAIGQRNGMSAGDIAAVRAIYPHLEPSRSWRGVQFRATIPANSTRRWFTHSWPHHWYVVWTVVPTAPVQDGPSQIDWEVQVCKQEEALLKYFISVKNLRAYPVTIEARYDVLGWSKHTF